MALIAVGGFQHETNTFAPAKADYRAFEAGGGWPGVRFGAAGPPRRWCSPIRRTIPARAATADTGEFEGTCPLKFK
jgi:microcystin degradation protein MlrC